MVLIRLAVPADAGVIAGIYRPYVEKTRISFEEQAPGAVEMRRRINGDRPGYHPWLVAVEGSTTLGFASSTPFRARRAYRWSVEIGIYLAAGAQGRGIGRSLLATLTQVLTRQGYVAAIGAIALPNEPSVHLHEELGFVHSGTYRATGYKLGEWVDVGLWQKDLAERTASPSEPSPFEGLIEVSADASASTAAAAPTPAGS